MRGQKVGRHGLGEEEQKIGCSDAGGVSVQGCSLEGSTRAGQNAQHLSASH